MIRSVYLLLFLAFSYTAIACINEKRALLSGEHIEGMAEGEIPIGRNLEEADEKAYFGEQLNYLDSVWKANKNIDDYSDYGVYLIYLGRYQEAKEVYHQIERTHPGQYATAANIGTIYELLGQNDSALYWIKKAVQIDPTSHMGSEWIHVKILEAKINGDAFVNSPFLIGTTFGNDIKPQTILSENELNKLRQEIFYQLEERMTFIKPENQLVGLLLFELGNITALTRDVTTALRIYDKAVEYGFVNDVLKKRYEYFLSLQKGLKNEYQNQKARPWEKKERPLSLVKNVKVNNGSPYKTIMWISGSLLALVAVVLIWRLKRTSYRP